MLKFFRSLRQNLLTENKTATYLKYAFGEILLVVIGILLALAISNWAEKKRSAKEEKELLILVKNSIQDDLLEVEKRKKGLERGLKSLDRILHHLKNEAAYPDSLYSDFAMLSANINLSFNQVAIKSFEEKEALVRNDDLRYAVLHLYNDTYVAIPTALENYRANLQTFFRPLLKTRFIYPDEFKFPSDGGTQFFYPMEPVNFSALKGDIAFNNAVKTCRSNRKTLLNRFNRTSADIKKVIELIEEELD